MLCDACKQHQATVHLTEIVDDQMTELHLCEQCASQKGAQMESHFGLADLLAGLADFPKPVEPEESPTLKCTSCGLTYEDFRKVGRLGCAECYATFRKSLGALLKRIHGSTHHMGKAPIKAGKASKAKVELLQLKRQLERAVDEENFEEAAKLRDKIRTLERGQ